MTVADHIDLSGYTRRGNEWGFNSFVDSHECEQSVRRFARRRSEWALWKLPDGTYTHTITGIEAGSSPSLPAGSVVVREFTV